eukprot:2440300-Rhodomonas_salina.1
MTSSICPATSASATAAWFAKPATSTMAWLWAARACSISSSARRAARLSPSTSPSAAGSWSSRETLDASTVALGPSTRARALFASLAVSAPGA